MNKKNLKKIILKIILYLFPIGILIAIIINKITLNTFFISFVSWEIGFLSTLLTTKEMEKFLN